MSLKKFFAIDKLEAAMDIIKTNGGIMKCISMSWTHDSLKRGTLVGVDEFGNKYYENNAYAMPRNRWIVYPRRVYLDYDASQIPPNWHRWLHHITDKTPTEHPLETRSWMLPHDENYSGTSKQYVPYSTVRPKIEAWTPPQPQKK